LKRGNYSGLELREENKAGALKNIAAQVQPEPNGTSVGGVALF
jgi:hypothetical protein